MLSPHMLPLEPVPHRVTPPLLKRSAQARALFVAEAFARHHVLGEPSLPADDVERVLQSIPERQAAIYNRIMHAEHRLRIFICRDLALKLLQLDTELAWLQERAQRMRFEGQCYQRFTQAGVWPGEEMIALGLTLPDASWKPEALAETTRHIATAAALARDVRAMAQAGLDHLQREELDIPTYRAQLEEALSVPPYRVMLEAVAHLPMPEGEGKLPPLEQLGYTASLYDSILAAWGVRVEEREEA